MIRFLENLCRWSGIIAAFLFVATAFIITYEALMRFLGSPTSWAFELSIFLVIIGAFLVQAVVMLEDAHIRVDVFVDMMSEKWRKFFFRLTLAAGLPYVLAMAWKGGTLTIEAAQSGRMTPGMFRMPYWVPYSAIPIGFGLLAIAVIIQIWRPRRAADAESAAREVAESARS